jgi:hypothetical protein
MRFDYNMIGGNSNLGYIYSPYVPLLQTPQLFDPNDFTPRRSVMSRYATQMINPEYYGTISFNLEDHIEIPKNED